MLTKPCHQCGEEFKPRAKTAKFCARACRRKAHRQAAVSRRAKYSYERRRAIWMVQDATFRKSLIPQPCETCGSPKTEAHHDDYAAPLDVRWLCHVHHKIHHLQHGPGKNA